MHISNAHNIATSPSNDHDRHDIFEATRTLAREMHRPANDKDWFIPRNEVQKGLMSIVGWLEHSQAFRDSLTKAFQESAEWLLYDNDFPAAIKHWDRQTYHNKIITWNAFNLVTVQNLRDTFGARLMNIETFPMNTRVPPRNPLPPLSSAENLSVRPMLVGGGHNTVTVATSRIAGYHEPYSVMGNMATANIFLLMETMAQNGHYGHVAKEFEYDKELWRDTKIHGGFVPSSLPEAFNVQYFRRVWKESVDGMVTHIRDGIEAMDIPQPPRPPFLKRLLSHLSLGA